MAHDIPMLLCARCKRAAVEGNVAYGGACKVLVWNWPTIILDERGPREFVLCEPCALQAFGAIGISLDDPQANRPR